MLWNLLTLLAVALMVGRLAFVWTRGRRARQAFRQGCEACETGDWAAAEAAFRRAVRLEPISALCRRLLGRSLAERGNATEAEEHLRMATALEPRNADGYLDLGFVLATQTPSRPEEAIDALTKAVELAPGCREMLAKTQGLEGLHEYERFRELLANPAIETAQTVRE